MEPSLDRAGLADSCAAAAKRCSPPTSASPPGSAAAPRACVARGSPRSPTCRPTSTRARSYVANLRAVQGRNPADEETATLVTELLESSDEFARLWQEHEVGLRTATRKRVVHPSIGTMTLDCQVLTAENQTERLIVFTAAPGQRRCRQTAAAPGGRRPALRGGRRRARLAATRPR